MGKVIHTEARKKRGRIFLKIIRSIAIVIILGVFLIPVLFIFGGSFKTQSEFYDTAPSLFPKNPTLGNYISAFGGEKTGITTGFTIKGRLNKGIRDSLLVSAIVTLLTMMIAIPASYSLARYKPGGDQISFFILSILFLPPVIGVLPLFFIFKTIGILDTYWVLFISHLFFDLPFCIWITKGFFEDIPLELEQAVMVDGYSRFRVFFKIAVPLAKSGIAVASLFAFIFSWNELMFASIFTRSSVQTLPLVLQDYIGSAGISWGELLAVASIAAVPGILLAIFMQRYIVRGLTFGAVKG
jgi:multiple sugar transport system permease protein